MEKTTSKKSGNFVSATVGSRNHYPKGKAD
uniref:Uncharacterized protein n=1 Tax=Arundo donax TaxID=35708 RepID=A0A0A9CEF0_ARUDO